MEPRPPQRKSKQKPKERPKTPPAEIVDERNSKIYSRLHLLGEGGFAKCYAVKDSKNEISACKVVNKNSLKSSKQRQKLLSEIKIHQALIHPHILLFKTVFEDDENVYFMLELCENKTFVEFIRTRKRLTEPETAFYMFQLFDGIRFMHRKGFIHRDIKLGNLLLSKEMNLKIGDFGLAAQIDHDGDRKKTICGTPNYIAPEILFDTQNGHSFEVDIWSLGVVMYTLLVGKPPFQTKNVKEIYQKIKTNEYDFPAALVVSDRAKSVIIALLNSKPEERPSIDDAMEHSFFNLENRPKSIPVSALIEIPHLEFHKKPSKTQEIPSSPLQNPSNTIHSVPKPPLAKIKSLHDFNSPREKMINRMRSMESPLWQTNENSPTLSKSSSPWSRDYQKRQPFIDIQKKSEFNKDSTEDLATSPLVNNQTPVKSKIATPTKYSNVENPSSTATEGNQITDFNPSPHGIASYPTTLTSPKKSGTLEAVYETLRNCLVSPTSDLGVVLQRISNLNINGECKPSTFITKWIDYTNKYGLSYQLLDGSVGVFFNDGTSIILASDGIHFEYLAHDNKIERNRMVRREHVMNEPPSDLTKKVTLLKHFKSYMNDNLTKAYTESADISVTKNMVFITKYLRTKNGVMFRLSNHSFQLNLFDHTKLVIENDGNLVTFFNKSRQMTTKSLGNWLTSENKEVVDRLRYFKDVIGQMILKKNAK